MSKSSNRPPVERFHFPNSRKLWHDGSGLTESLGCQRCPYKLQCGGLQVEAAVFDCLTYCRCTDPSTCDNVCPRNVEHLVARAQEVSGLDLENVASAPAFPAPTLPPLVPMIYHSSARSRAPQAPVVALSLYELFNKRDGTLRFSTRQALLEHFKLDPAVGLILSGTDRDRPLERWWGLRDREVIIRGLARLGVALITTPNYSLFDDVPRPDNLYNMKRIALIWSEIQREGMPCALHVNARTERDWERWVEFLDSHPEISHLTFEFGTGAGAKLRMPWHIAQLSALARQVRRPLHLIVRGGLNQLATLRAGFTDVTLIDTAAFLKAQKRQRATIRDGHVGWQKSPTPQGEPIDDLFDANIGTLAAYITGVVPPPARGELVSAESCPA